MRIFLLPARQEKALAGRVGVAALQGLLVTGLILVGPAQRGGRTSLAEAADLEAAGISLMVYGGLRPGEALNLPATGVRETNAARHATKTGQTRTVRLLAPLAKDLREWTVASHGPVSEREDQLALLAGRNPLRPRCHGTSTD
jgi:hypothetical protein